MKSHENEEMMCKKMNIWLDKKIDEIKSEEFKKKLELDSFDI